MDVGSASALSLYTYQSTLKSGGQASAVQQALGDAYSSLSASASPKASDPLAALAGASAIGPLVSAITALGAHASGSSSNAIAGLQSPTFGGLDANSAAGLLASLGTKSDTSGLQGFTSAVGSASLLAIQAYQSQQNHPVSTPSAKTSPTSAPTTTVADTSPRRPAEAAAHAAPTQEQAAQAAIQQVVQAVSNPSLLSLLA